MFDPETRAAHLTMARDTAMGPVLLHVRDLDGMTAYYRDVLTLQVIAATDAGVTLGRADRPLVELRVARDKGIPNAMEPGAQPDRHDAG